ncbi:hypothetical protein YC2023_045020 [Brassica napus]
MFGFGRGKNPLCLVLAPTRELARQVEKEFREFAPSLDTICLYGGEFVVLDEADQMLQEDQTTIILAVQTVLPVTGALVQEVRSSGFAGFGSGRSQSSGKSSFGGFGLKDPNRSY